MEMGNGKTSEVPMVRPRKMLGLPEGQMAGTARWLLSVSKESSACHIWNKDENSENKNRLLKCPLPIGVSSSASVC
jgi:hypothetical protein